MDESVNCYVKEKEGFKELGFVENDGNKSIVDDIMFLDFRVKAGDIINKGDELLVAEFAKGTTSVQSPIPGKVKEVNSEVAKDPEILKKDVAEWLVRVSDDGQ